MPSTITSFSEEEIDMLSNKIAINLLPMLVEALKSKAEFTVNKLQGEHFTVKQVADMFQISVKTMYRMVDNDELVAQRIGKRGIRFSRNEIEKARQDGRLGHEAC